MKFTPLLFFCTLVPVFLFSDPLPIAPPPLKPGDTIAVIAPASSPEEDQQTVARSINKLLEKGYRVRIAPNLMTRYGYLAGTDYDRSKAFMDAWLDPEVKAVWCYRGGFGCARILDRLDFKAIGEHPKILIGMSDITALHAAINKETGLITFLGPNLNAVYGKDEKSDKPFNQTELWKIISSETIERTFSKPDSFPLSRQSVMTIRQGTARGRLTGGNLSIVASLIGTPWEINTEGKILVLEEVDEEPFRIDRMLQQLKQAGLLSKPAGVILCSWKGCLPKRPDKSLTIEHLFREYFAGANYPVLLGFPSGHIIEQTTLPLNAMAELDATKKSLILLEVPVRNLLAE